VEWINSLAVPSGLIVDAFLAGILLWRMGVTPAAIWREIRRLAGDR
jgi:hypothetical protein